MFRNFENTNEELLATEIIGKIDKGEKWIFQGADNCPDFGGFIDRLFYSNKGTYGTYCASIFSGNLRFQIGFNTDMPDEISNELLLLMTKARNQLNTSTSVWYPPDNTNLHEFLFMKLPWRGKGHKTHELTFRKEEKYDKQRLPENICIIPFTEEYLDETCYLLDVSLSHTFNDPSTSLFLANKKVYLPDWLEKAETNDCCIMLVNSELAGVYVLKGAEIDFMAIEKDKQNRGLGCLLLHHAREHIFTTKKDEPYLYCIDGNSNALRFYLREGMKITGYSGYAFFEVCTNNIQY